MTNSSTLSYADTLSVLAGDGTIAQQFVMPFRAELIGRTGFLHGGAIAGFLALVCDQAAGDGAHCFTSTFQFLRGARELNLYAVATVVRGASIATVTASAWQDDERRPVASACRKYRLD